LLHLRKQVCHGIGVGYHGITHITPDDTASITNIAYKINELVLYEYQPNRAENHMVKAVADALSIGEKKLKSLTLLTFNKKVRSMIAGKEVEMETDELPPVDFDLLSHNDD
jgi:hypothetical protein